MKQFLILGIILSLLSVRYVDDAFAKAEANKEKQQITRNMEMPNPEGRLSGLSFILGDEAFIAIFADLTVTDVMRLWNDLVYFHKATSIRKIHIFINSSGGDAFSGLALSDQIARVKKLGFEVVGHASGVVASAAVPIFAVCTQRISAPGAIFMVHEPGIWKRPGRESASNIRAQNELMTLMRHRYLLTLASHSSLSIEEWTEIEGKITWFSAKQAKKWGLVDEIE